MPNPTDKFNTGVAFPETDSFKEAQSNVLESKYNPLYGDMSQSVDDFAKSISHGESISDLINQTEATQAKTEDLLKNYNPAVPKTAFSGGNSEGDVYNKLYKAINPSTPTLKARNVPYGLGTQSEFERYSQSNDFEQFGFTPNLGSEQEYKYGRAMGWGETIGKALGGGAHLAADTFIEGWKGWGRMAEAVFTLDSSKLMGSEEERYKMAKEQEDIMNKYAIYDNETSADGIFNRQFFGTMLQQSGFAVGAGLQFAMEEFLTGGLATFAQPFLKASMIARGVKNLEKAEDLINTTRKVMGTVTKQERIVKSIADGAKKLVPLYGTAEEMSKLYKAGAGYLQLGMTGLGGIKRGLSEFNMARSESIYESAGTYKQLTDRLVQEYTEANGKAPEGDDLEKIKQHAEDASHDNFWTNVGVLSVMNRIQFNNVFKGFSKSRSILGEGLADLEGQAFSVTGKVAGKTETRAFKKGILGEFGSFGEVSKVFGKKTAAWEAAKSVGKGLMKFEGSEGMQELIQNASSAGLQDYYYDLYHGKKGYTGKLDATLANMQNPLTDTEGMKTFLMGALTGRLIAPMTLGISKGQEAISNLKNKKNDPNYQTKADRANESIKMLNAFYADPSQFKKEWIASVKVNNKAAETMDEAAMNHNRYVFYNHKDSAFAKTVASAIKLDMFDSMRDVLKEYGNEMNDDEFKQAFGIEATADNKKNVKNFTGTIVNQMESYHTIYHNLMDKYGDRVLPELYKNNDPARYIQAIQSKKALQDAIELLATNTYKSQQAVVRASNLQSEISENKNIGSSSLEVLTKMGSEEALDEHIDLLSEEIKSMEGGTLTADGKELLKNKKEELKLANKWKDAYSELTDNTDESRSPVTEGRAYNAFADLVNVFNKRNKLTTSISKEDVDDVFTKINDYIRLNKDNKSYVDAMNLLADPNNITLVTNAMYDAIGEMRETFKKEHKEEIKEAVGKEDELDADDLERMAKEFEVPEDTEEDPELEAFLKEEYERVKKGLKDDQTLADYETWKEGPGKFVAKRFYKQKEKEQKEKEKGKETPTSSSTKGHYKINGRIITMEGIPGSIDFTGAAKGSDMSAMPEITKLVSTWDNDFVKERLINFNGQFIFNYQGRVCVLVEVGRFIVPYYFSSSGTSGKTIDWHYIFGVDDLNGWLIKGGVDEKGEMEYSSKMKSTYPKAIAELEKIKKEIREKLPMTEDQKNAVAGQLGIKNRELSKKYNKSLSDIYKDLDVVAGTSPDGIITNENYHWLIANTLALTGMDAKKETKTPIQDDKKAIIIDGKPAHFTETRTREDGNVEMDYIYDIPEGVSQTEEEYENSKGTIIINPKTKTATDTSGKVVVLTKPTTKTEETNPPPPPPPDTETNVIKKYTVKKDDATSKWYIVDQNGKTVAKDFNTALDASNYVENLSGFREAKIAEFQKKIDEIQKKIDEFPDDGVIVNGDVITFDQNYINLTNELENLKQRKEAFEKELIYGDKEVNELVNEIKAVKLVKEAYDEMVNKVNKIINKLSDAYKKIVNRALADKKAEIDSIDLEDVEFDDEGNPIPTYKKGFSYKGLKVGQVLNIISKDDPSVIGTLTVSSIEKPDFVRFDMNFSNGFQEDSIGYSQKEFNELFTVVEKHTDTETNKAEKKLREIWNTIGNSAGRNALEEGWAESFGYIDETLSVGGQNYQSHGMGKSGFPYAIRDLFELFNKGIDPNRGGGQLYTGPLAISEENKAAASAIGTAGGTAYTDGAFVLVAKKGIVGIKSISDIGGILVNHGLTDINPEILTELRKAFPDLVIENYKNAKELVEQLNKKAEQENPEEEIEIEPEYEAGDYKRAYAIGRAIAQGKDVNTPENTPLLTNYPKLIDAAVKIEEERIQQLEENFNENDVDLINAINDTYDERAKDLIATGKPFPEEVDVTGEINVPATAQMLDRNKFTQMETDALYASSDFQEGYRQLFPSTSLANTTDFVKVDGTSGINQYVRNGVNPNYVFDVATREFTPGTRISYKVMTNDEDFDNMSANRITGKKYVKSEIFDDKGKVNKKMYYETPIQIIATIRGKETVIGHVREPLWIQHKIGGKYANIATPDGVDPDTHVKSEMTKNMKLRDLILDTYNKNSKFVITGHVSAKSNGILKMGELTGFLKDRIDPRIGEGGSDNEHGYFAIVRNGRLESNINIEADKVVETISFTKNVDRLSGVPALMLPTPNGGFIPTFVGLPKVDQGQAEFIIEAWKAFTGQSENPALVAAVYKTLNRVMSGKTPSIGVLRDYISQYITTLEHSDVLDRLGTGNDVPPGSARLNIFDDGNLGIEIKDDIEVKNGKKTNEWFNNNSKPIRKASELPENIISLLQNLRMTIKFNDRKNDDLVGINNKKKVDFLSMKDGKLVTKQMTYNQYVMEKANTFVEKGTQSENTNKDWVYFANPVVELTHTKPSEIEPDIFNKEETPPPTLKEVDGPKEDKASALLAAIKAKKLSAEQVEEKKKECLQTKINNIL